MANNKYIIKEITPWMMDELIVFSQIVNYDIIFLRKQRDFFKEDLDQLEKKGIHIYVKPYAMGNLFKKLRIVISFLLHNLGKFSPDYNGVIGFKSIMWFLKLDLSLFGPDSNMHAQFATQPTIISLLIKQYYKGSPSYSFTFHAYDIYFNNNWFSLLTKHCHRAYSISSFNIDYVTKKYGKSANLELARLGVFRDQIHRIEKPASDESKIFTFGLMTWFDKKKGIIFLLKAMLELKRRGYENIRLILAGDGSLKNEFLEFIDLNKLDDSVRYVGKIKREEKQDFFNSLDAFVLPSIALKNDQDGIPVVLMEAIAYSLPIISTDVSGIPEICRHQYNGHLVPERDVDALVNSIIYFYDHKEKRDEYARNSFVLSNEYDITLNSKKKMESLGWK